MAEALMKDNLAGYKDRPLDDDELTLARVAAEEEGTAAYQNDALIREYQYGMEFEAFLETPVGKHIERELRRTKADCQEDLLMAALDSEQARDTQCMGRGCALVLELIAEALQRQKSAAQEIKDSE